MTEMLAERVGRWDLSGATSTTGEFFNQIHERITFLQRLHYDQYLPTMGSDQLTDFENRLTNWLDNLNNDDDRRLFLELVPQIIFFGREEFNKLYQAAFRGPVTRWIIEQTGLNFLSPNFQSTLLKELHESTWFCSVSDSMQISDFCHANHIGGINYRPDFRTLCKFGDLNKILSFMRGHQNAIGNAAPLKRIVILEDFIGSGTQLKDAAPLILDLLNQNIPILLSPLIVCPDGVTKARQMFGANGLFQLDWVVHLNTELFINSRSNPQFGTFAAKIKDLLIRCYAQVEGDRNASPRPYSAFGCFDTGALVVLYSNTPANTLPVIQHRSNTWVPLFPRSARVK